MGNACRRIVEQPIRDLLAMPYEEARKAVGITTPHYYQAVHRQWQSEGIYPYDLLAAVKKAALFKTPPSALTGCHLPICTA